MPKKRKDLLLVNGPTEDGGGVHVVRARPEHLEVGTMRPLQHGRPIDGEVVRVNRHPDWPFLYEVETELSLPAKGDSTEPVAGEKPAAQKAPDAARASGPPQVASDAYRKNWDLIWNRSTKRRQVLN